MRFSEIGLSSSNFPSLKLTQREPTRLSKRTQADSKWKFPLESDEGRMTKETFLNRVPAVHISTPEISKPLVDTRCSVWPLAAFPEILSTATRSLLSRCHCGVMRKVMGQ